MGVEEVPHLHRRFGCKCSCMTGVGCGRQLNVELTTKTNLRLCSHTVRHMGYLEQASFEVVHLLVRP